MWTFGSRRSYARYAIDGNTDGDMEHWSCSRTLFTTDPWWKVTFTDDILATDVIIINRADCCGEFSIGVVIVNTTISKYHNSSILVGVVFIG